MATGRARRLPPVLAGALLLASVWWASLAISSPEPLLASLDPVVAPLAASGAARVQAESSGRFEAALALAAFAGAALLLRRSASRRGAATLACACAFGWLGQSFLVAGARLPGIACFAVALALCAFVWRPGEADARAPLPLWIETLAWLGLAAVFAAASLHRLDVRPEPNLDERAYFNAARMQIGDLERGPVLRLFGSIVYDFPRFQAQPVPHGLESGALLLFGKRITSARLASLLLAGAALLGFAACVRSRWGPCAALLTLGMGATAPLMLAYAQRGYYIAASELHAVVCFALLLRLERLRTLGAAALLGALLGASIYLYQLTWFVPPLCALCLLATPPLWKRRHAPQLAALVATALLVALPAAWSLRDGLRQVYAQSVDKLLPTLRTGIRAADPTLQDATLLARGAAADAVQAKVARFRERGLFAEPSFFGARFAALAVAGPAGDVESAVAELVAERWTLLPGARNDSLAARARGMLSQLFVGPSLDQIDSALSGPALEPLVAPLLLLGVAVAWRRRDDVLARFLALWVAAGSLVPALVASPLPRRAILALPFGFALAAGAVLEATRSAPGAQVSRTAADLARATLVALALLGGVACYYGTWVARTPAPGDAKPPPNLLAIEDVVRGLPEERTFLVANLLRSHVEVTHALRAAGVVEPSLLRAPEPPTPAQVRRVSCRRELPFTWLTLDSTEWRAAFEALAVDHELTRFENSGLLVARVTGRAAEACAPHRARRQLAPRRLPGEARRPWSVDAPG